MVAAGRGVVNVCARAQTKGHQALQHFLHLRFLSLPKAAAIEGAAAAAPGGGVSAADSCQTSAVLYVNDNMLATRVKLYKSVVVASCQLLRGT